MEHGFDSLAKAVSSAISRREVFWRLGSGLTLALGSFFRLGMRDPNNCAQCCATACASLDPPPRGLAMALCIQKCFETGLVTDENGFEFARCDDVCVPSTAA